METKFTSLDNKKQGTKTVFTKSVNLNLEIEITRICPNSFDNVCHIGYDKVYGDVFKCWESDSPNDFTIYFGTAGDEFNK